MNALRCIAECTHVVAILYVISDENEQNTFSLAYSIIFGFCIHKLLKSICVCNEPLRFWSPQTQTQRNTREKIVAIVRIWLWFILHEKWTGSLLWWIINEYGYCSREFIIRFDFNMNRYSSPWHTSIWSNWQHTLAEMVFQVCFSNHSTLLFIQNQSYWCYNDKSKSIVVFGSLALNNIYCIISMALNETILMYTNVYYEDLALHTIWALLVCRFVIDVT